MGNPPTPRGLDTNVLVRYLVADEPTQHAAAVALVENELTPERPGLVHPVALVELVWVLRQVYRVPKLEIVTTLRRLLTVRSVHVLEAHRVRDALDLWEAHGADFADALLHTAYVAEGGALVTFDRAAGRYPGAHRLDG